MEINKKIQLLTNFGLSKTTLSKLNESQLNLLFEKYKKMKKGENNEEVQVVTTQLDSKNPQDMAKLNGMLKNPTSLQGKNVQVKETEISEDETDDITSLNAYGDEALQSYDQQELPHDANDMAPDGMDDDSDNDRSNMGVSESSINEKFESKAQQGLFWARCNKCSDKKCKWCKMAKEFSDSTSKKQYKDMPEKKHPEKTVKYKKEKTNESEQEYWEKEIIKMVQENIRPKMSKKDLINTIKKKSKESDSMILRRPKKLTMFSDEAPMELPIDKMFSIGKK
jgi:hypothetical protein